MRKRIITYRKRIDKLLEENSIDTDWNSCLKEHLIQIEFFQHERLIHLIVTMTVAILTIISLGIAICSSYLPLYGIVALFLILLIPYIAHYYILENEVQRMYDQYDSLIKK